MHLSMTIVSTLVMASPSMLRLSRQRSIGAGVWAWLSVSKEGRDGPTGRSGGTFIIPALRTRFRASVSAISAPFPSLAATSFNCFIPSLFMSVRATEVGPEDVFDEFIHLFLGSDSSRNGDTEETDNRTNGRVQ